MVTEAMMRAIEGDDRETMYRTIYQLFLYAPAGSPLETAACGALAEMRDAWGMTEADGTAIEQKMDKFLAERGALLKAAGHYSLGIAPPVMH